MKFRTLLRFHRLPMPNTAVEDLGGGGSPPPPPPPPGGGDAWYAKDPEWAEASKDVDLKGWVEKANPKSPIALLKTHRELETKLGGALQPWKDGEDPAQWAGWDKLGVPKEAAGYKDKVKVPTMPEGMTYDQKEHDAYLEYAAKTRTPIHIAQQNIDFIAQRRIAEREEVNKLTAAEKTNLDGLYKEWGVPQKQDGSFDTTNHPKVQLAQRAFKAAGMDGELAAQLDGFIGGARMMKLFAQLGANLKEGQLIEGEVHGATTKEGALAKIKELDDKHLKGGLSKEEKAERSRLFAIAYPSAG